MLRKNEHNEALPKMSEMMVKLYGHEEAQKVYDRCQEVDPWFNHYVQRTIYDTLWALPPLNLIQKSLATIVALSTLRKEEQLQIHIKGFYHLGGTPEDLRSVFTQMLQKNYIRSIESLRVIMDSVQYKKTTSTQQMQFTLSDQTNAIVDLAALAALGDNVKTKECIHNVTSHTTLSEEEIRGVLRHIMTYSGCPCTMNAFAMLTEINAENSQL